KQEIQVIGHLHAGQNDSKEELHQKYLDCCSNIKRLAQQIRRSEAGSRELYAVPEAYETLEVKSNVTKDQFINMVERAKEYIASGDIFQVVLSQRFEIADT